MQARRQRCGSTKPYIHSGSSDVRLLPRPVDVPRLIIKWSPGSAWLSLPPVRLPGFGRPGPGCPGSSLSILPVAPVEHLEA